MHWRGLVLALLSDLSLPPNGHSLSHRPFAITVLGTNLLLRSSYVLRSFLHNVQHKTTDSFCGRRRRKGCRRPRNGSDVRRECLPLRPKSHRLHTRHPSRRLAPFHELSPKILHYNILHLVFARRSRRSCCACTWADLKIRCCIGHGDRSLHNVLLTLLLVLVVSDFRPRLPVPNCPRLQQSLHVHVQFSRNGF